MVEDIGYEDAAGAVVEQRADLLAHVLSQALFDVIEQFLASNLRVLLARLALVARSESLHVVLEEEAAVARRDQISNDLAAVFVLKQLLGRANELLYRREPLSFRPNERRGDEGRRTYVEDAFGDEFGVVDRVEDGKDDHVTVLFERRLGHERLH